VNFIWINGAPILRDVANVMDYRNVFVSFAVSHSPEKLVRKFAAYNAVKHYAPKHFGNVSFVDMSLGR
jgi:hypothetical protein